MAITHGYTPGDFDRFHVGHLRIPLPPAQRCDRLTVGVATDALATALTHTSSSRLREKMQQLASV